MTYAMTSAPARAFRGYGAGPVLQHHDPGPLAPADPPVTLRQSPTGQPYKALSKKAADTLRTDLVVWKIRNRESRQDGGGQYNTEIVTMTPYVEATGPRDPGDGFRWMENRRVMGRGLIVTPPLGWVPGMTLGFKPSLGTGAGPDQIVVAYATEDPSYLELAAPTSQNAPTFVAYEPAQRWGVNVGPGPDPGTDPLPGAGSKVPTWLVPAGIATVVIAGAAYLGLRR